MMFKKRNEEPMEITLKKPNHTLQLKYPVLGDNPRMQIELGEAYLQS